MTPMPLRILRRTEVQARTGLSRSTLYDRLNPQSSRFDSSFPRPLKLGKSAIGFIESEVNAWLEARIAAREVLPC